LTDAEIESVHNGLLDFILARTGGEVRGR
jgi:hypothetical protein